jgi:hypothetical protein
MRTLFVLGFAALALAAPGRQATAVRIEIVHLVQGCHAWSRASHVLGPATTITVRRGTQIVVRANCPMDFDFAQVAGPPLALGAPRTYAGAQRVIRFNRPGRYKLTAVNVQTPEERGLHVLGPPNVLVLTVVVR